MGLVGLWRTRGEHGPQDVTEGLNLLQKAAEKHYGPAMYEIAVRRIEGRDLPRDWEAGFKQMKGAAELGSKAAQVYLGNCYERGVGVAREPERASRYYRLCAAEGVAFCQYRLGRLLYDAPRRRERDYLQAVALFQLAAEGDWAEAKTAAAAESTGLTPEQAAWVKTLKVQIVRK